jgi:hypothetical protein
LLNPYCANGTICRHRAATLSRGYPLATPPAMKWFPCSSISSLIFFPIALRSVSARAIENPAIVTAMRITCSW